MGVSPMLAARSTDTGKMPVPRQSIATDNLKLHAD